MDQAFLVDSVRSTVYPYSSETKRLLDSLSSSSGQGSESQPSTMRSKLQVDSTDVEPPVATASENLEPTYFGESQQTLVNSDEGTRSPSPELSAQQIPLQEQAQAKSPSATSLSSTGSISPLRHENGEPIPPSDMLRENIAACESIPPPKQSIPIWSAINMKEPLQEQDRNSLSKSPSARSSSAKSPSAKSPSAKAATAKATSSTGSISPSRHEEEENIPPDYMLRDSIAARQSITPIHRTPLPPAINSKGYPPNTKTLNQQNLCLPSKPLQESLYRYPPRRRSNSNELDLGQAEERQAQTAPSVSSPSNNDADAAVSLLRDQLRSLAGNDGSSAIVNAVSRLQQGIDAIGKKLDKLDKLGRENKERLDTLSYNLSAVHDLAHFLYQVEYKQIMAADKKAHSS
ncbi:hypothetical protein BJ508DRAFT_337087 [Ascobolus immersus RN42]|uniref:Uncharacterized protein n=1 Tax=Ascobolus immersus RN42 TaxID=1160509 RepID=A0A3N4H940_ASCIM|nr:hypothetical protein BJ508DRAFT_337087 [Ascobolus immersus RN42]